MSLVLGDFGKNIGEVTIGTIPFKRLSLFAFPRHGTSKTKTTRSLWSKPIKKQEQSIAADKRNLPMIKPKAAGIDIGADRHWVSIPVDRDSESVRSERLFYSRAICNG